MATNGSSAKRSRAELEAEDSKPANVAGHKADDASSSEDDDIGPALPSATATPAKKKRRILPHENLYLAALPTAQRYSRSLMHKDLLSLVTFTPTTGFLITSSIDGQVSFWKKTGEIGDVEFVKKFQAHQGEITSVSVSWNGRNFATAGVDGTVKVFDVVTFDLLTVITPAEKKPRCVCWVGGRGGSELTLAVGNDTDGEIHIWDGRGERTEPLRVVKGVHRKPVVAMAYNPRYDCVISADDSGMVEYWQPGGSWAKPEGVFNMKSETNLFDFKKAKSVPSSITISPAGQQFATFSFPDRLVRVFDFRTARLHRTYDESTNTLQTMQQAGTAPVELKPADFGGRLALEQTLGENAFTRSRANVIFDETGNFVLYGSMYGIKVVNTTTNKVIKVYGQEERLRPLNLALYQGQPDRKGVVTVEMAASENPLLRDAEARDAVLVTTSLSTNRNRFFLFTNDDTIESSTRDVVNERPTAASTNELSTNATTAAAEAGTHATLHTTYGDISFRLFPTAAPLTVENFTTLSKRGAYDNCLFHRVIRKFMIQTGDFENGDGTGGQSIWGGEFEDEIGVNGVNLKFDRPYTLAMANAGPGTNASQFFITTEKCPWLDGKHTIFGRVSGGADVIHRIENTRVHKEKPVEEIKIINISIE